MIPASYGSTKFETFGFADMIMNTFHLNAPSGPAQTAPLGSLTPTYVRIWAETARELAVISYEVYTYF